MAAARLAAIKVIVVRLILKHLLAVAQVAGGAVARVAVDLAAQQRVARVILHLHLHRRVTMVAVHPGLVSLLAVGVVRGLLAETLQAVTAATVALVQRRL